MIHNILITGNFENEALEVLKKFDFNIETYDHRSLIEETDLIQALQGKSAYILGGDERVSSRVIASVDTLRVISFLGTAPELFIDVAAAHQKGIIVTRTLGANKEAVAEMAITLLLSMHRNIAYLDERARCGDWMTYQARELKGKTLGIVGMGLTGQRTAEIARFGLNMQVIYHSRRKQEDVEQKIQAKMVPLQELVGLSDAISLHCPYDPLNPITKNMLSQREFDLMQPHTVLVNIASPHLVNGKDLYNALIQHQIAAAAFDGYYTEPHPPLPENDEFGLLRLPRSLFVLTPHVAWRTYEADIEMCILAAKNVIQALNS